jgi:hypothetical protein
LYDVRIVGISIGSTASVYVGMAMAALLPVCVGMGIFVDRKWWRWTVTLGWGWADPLGNYAV